MGEELGLSGSADKRDRSSSLEVADGSKDGETRELTKRELKIKQYAESFHAYFLKQRKITGADKVLESNSDSSLDERLEESIDGLMDRAE